MFNFELLTRRQPSDVVLPSYTKPKWTVNQIDTVYVTFCNGKFNLQGYRELDIYSTDQTLFFILLKNLGKVNSEICHHIPIINKNVWLLSLR